MGLPTTNPYYIKDMNTIIDAFCDPTEYGEQTPGPQIRAGIVGVPDWVKNLGGANSYAALSNRLQTYIDQAKGAVTSLYSYGTQTRSEVDIPGVEGVEMGNTWNTMVNAENAGDAFKTLVADCLPCKDRILALLSLNPLADLWAHIERMYQQATSFLLDLYDFFLGDKSIGVLADFCSLFQFLNFMCLPDLAGIIIVLSKLIAKYTIKLSSIQVSFMSIIGTISGPALTPLMATVEKYIQLIIAPIECIVAALDAQLEKLDVERAWEAARTKQDISRVERNFTLDSVGAPLRMVKKYLMDAVDEVKEEFKKIDESMKDLLGVQEEMDKQMLDISYNIEQCAKIIGLVQAIIMAISEGQILCGPGDETGDENLKNFIANFAGPKLDMDVLINEGEAVMRPKTPEDIGNILSAVEKLSGEKPAIKQISVPVKNCLYTVTDAELQNVKEFLGDFGSK